MLYRKLNAGDAPSSALLGSECYPDSAGSHPISLEEREEDFIDNLEDCEAYGVFDGTKLIGYALACINTLPDSLNRVYISQIDIHPDYRNKGIGARLLETTLAAIDTQYPTEEITLEVYRKNERAIHLYQKFGFTIRPEQKEIPTIEVMLRPAYNPDHAPAPE